jgi:hypothetical protein
MNIYDDGAAAANRIRARWALAALATYGKHTRQNYGFETLDIGYEVLGEVGGDLLCDLFHLARFNDMEPEELFHRGVDHFEYEVREEGEEHVVWVQCRMCEWYTDEEIKEDGICVSCHVHSIGDIGPIECGCAKCEENAKEKGEEKEEAPEKSRESRYVTLTVVVKDKGETNDPCDFLLGDGRAEILFVGHQEGVIRTAQELGADAIN